jgi:two-component system, sensor histidine kinase and response regulator
MKQFDIVLYEGTLVAFGRILSRYNAFAQGMVLKDVGKDLLSYLRNHGFSFEETGDVSDLGKLVQMFLDGGFAQSLSITPASEGDNYTWTELLLLDAYKELQDSTENPFLSCPLNLCLYYLADRHNKVMKLHEKTFDMERRVTISRWELVDKPALAEGAFDPLVIENARLLQLSEERADHLAAAQQELHLYAERLRVAKENAERQTSLLQMQAEHLVEARESALRAARIKSEFLARMSHEIRTPMNGVIGMADLLANTPLSEEQRYYTDTIVSSGEALLRIINDVLDLSKIEAGKIELEVVDFDLREVVESTIAILGPAAGRKGLDLAGAIDGAVNRRVLGDPGRLRQVLLNLLGNAIKFTDEGAVLLRADLLGRDGEMQKVRFRVIDSGIGVRGEDQERLFAPFSQLDSKPKSAGTGLGLTISKHLVGLMRGDIWLESEPGRGSTFSFTAQFGEHARPNDLVCHSFQETRTLLVSSSPAYAAVVCQQLKNCGLRGSIVAPTKAPAVLKEAAAAGNPFGIMLLDSLTAPQIEAVEQTVRAYPGCEPIVVALHPLKASCAPSLRGSHIIRKPVQESGLEQLLVRLSAERAELQSRPPTTDASIANLSQAVRAPLEAQEPPRILVVEDNPINQRVAIKILETLGYRADLATDGREGIDAHFRNPYELIFMDCMMPGLDGFEATAEIRQREQDGKRCRIIALTGNVLDGDRAKCLAAGMDGYLPKPVRPADMIVCLGTWLAAEAATHSGQARNSGQARISK